MNEKQPGKRHVIWLGPSLLLATAVVLAALALVAAAAPASGPAAAPLSATVYVSENITQTTTWVSGNTYVLQGVIAVLPGVTLTVEPGVEVRAASSDNGMIVQGNLVANGTADRPVLFTSVGDGPPPDHWRGLRFEGSPRSLLQYSIIRYAGYGTVSTVYSAVDVGYGAHVVLSNTQVLNGPANCIARILDYNDSSLATLEMYSTTVRGCWQMGIKLSTTVNGSNVLTATNLILENNGDHGLQAFYNNRLAFRGGRVANNGGDGVVTWGGPLIAEMAGVVFDGNAGYGLKADDATSIGTLRGLTFRNNGGVPLRVDAGGLEQILHDPTSVLEASNAVRRVDVLGGTLTTNTTLSATEAITTYRIVGYNTTLDVGTGTTLRLLPGVRIEGSLEGTGGSGGHGIRVYGAVQARGTVTLPVIFTSHYDAATGQTWGGIEIEDGGQADLQRAEIRYASTGIRMNGNASVALDGVTIRDSAGDGLQVWGGNGRGTVANSTIYASGENGVYNGGTGTLVLGGTAAQANSIYGNARMGAFQAGADGYMVAPYNWWGNVSGPYHATLNPSGLGNAVSDRVAFTPWLTSTTQPPATTGILTLQALGPSSVSPGEEVNLGVHFSNGLSETLQDAVVVAQLPQVASYVFSSGGGQYWSRRHEVVWKLGDVRPGESADLGVRIAYQWGLPVHTMTTLRARLAARNRPLSQIDLDTYLSFTETKTIAEQPLSATQVTATLAADPQLADLFTYAQELGYQFSGTAVTKTLSNGFAVVELWLIKPGETPEILVAQRVNQRWLLKSYSPIALKVFDRRGGITVDVETGAMTPWGALAEVSLAGATAVDGAPEQRVLADEFTYGECYYNCVAETMAVAALANRIKTLNAVLTSADCFKCRKGDQQSCAKCLAAAHDIPGVGETIDIYNCNVDCVDPTTRVKHACRQDLRVCVDQPGFLGLTNRSCVQIRRCTPSGNYLIGTEIEVCNPPFNLCRDGQCSSTPVVDGQPLTELGMEVRVAHDPNAKSGPARVAPGQPITYVIDYQNLGEGTAYGVYVEDQLPPALDETTLQIGSGGFYFPSTHTLYWDVGTLAPGAGGRVSFQVRVRPEARNGTAIVNRATVFFPSVPEETPTGDMVSVVETLAAHPQSVETTVGASRAITLTGATAAPAALDYRLVALPLNGALHGASPVLTYTPVADFVGLDRFAFRVSDGLSESAPANVTILVRAGADTVPPEVVAASPVSGTQGVPVDTSPVITGTYLPAIWVQLSEPLSATTVTTATLFVRDQQGRQLAGQVEYDGSWNAARFVLGEPLQAGTVYTATVTTGVKDASGNSLRADYNWTFRAGSFRVYIPLMLKR